MNGRSAKPALLVLLNSVTPPSHLELDSRVETAEEVAALRQANEARGGRPVFSTIAGCRTNGANKMICDAGFRLVTARLVFRHIVHPHRRPPASASGPSFINLPDDSEHAW